MNEAPDDGTPARTNRRRLLETLGALGVTALAGCGGDGDDDATPTATSGETADGTSTSRSDADTPTDTVEPTPTPTTTPTPSGCNIPDPPDPLVSFDDVRDGAVVISPNSETIVGNFTNPYIDATLESGSVELEVPEGAWTIEPARANGSSAGSSSPAGEVISTIISPSMYPRRPSAAS